MNGEALRLGVEINLEGTSLTNTSEPLRLLRSGRVKRTLEVRKTDKARKKKEGEKVEKGRRGEEGKWKGFESGYSVAGTSSKW